MSEKQGGLLDWFRAHGIAVAVLFIAATSSYTTVTTHLSDKEIEFERRIAKIEARLESRDTTFNSKFDLIHKDLSKLSAQVEILMQIVMETKQQK